jgi:hypothetical protein
MDEDHGDDQVLRFGKEQREKQKAQDKGDIHMSSLFCCLRHLASVITFKIDNHTINRSETRIEMRLSKCQ